MTRRSEEGANEGGRRRHRGSPQAPAVSMFWHLATPQNQTRGRIRHGKPELAFRAGPVDLDFMAHGGPLRSSGFISPVLRYGNGLVRLDPWTMGWTY